MVCRRYHLLVVTIPAYNESQFLEKAVRTLLKETKALENDYIIVIAEDGSTDGSDIIAQRLAKENPHIIHIHADTKLGRGLALKNAWKKVNGSVYVYLDCDLATDMKYYPQLITAIKKGYDLATGSRYIKGAKVRRPGLRHFVSRMYNLIVRVAFKTHVYDHQIGFKAFSGKLVKDLLDACESTDWFWDTEIIVRSVHKGYKCLEFPVEWEEKRGTRTPLKRLLKDVYIHGKGFLKLSISLKKWAS
ncbi:MAG: glycosyltransferase [Candidatus Bathyarchaeales archaeon]